MAGQAKGYSYTIPAPTGGINALSPYDNMAENDAIMLENIFPENTQCRIRRGHKSYSTIVGSIDNRTLIEYVGADGTRKLLCAAGGAIYDASLFNQNAISIGSGYVNNDWKHVHHNGHLFLVNGTDFPLRYNYDSTSITNNLSNINFTSADSTLSFSSTNFIHVTSYKSRLYFLERGSRIWYTKDTDAIQGQLKLFNASSLLRKGGQLIWCGSWTRDTGNGSQDIFVMISDQGEVLSYTGSYPNLDWTSVGYFVIPRPLGAKAINNIGADLSVQTEQNIIAFSDVLKFRTDSLNEYGGITERIGDLYREHTRVYGNNNGWTSLLYPRGNMIIYNVPVVPNVSYVQFVVNINTRAWTMFKNINAISWCLFNNKPFFAGTDGKIYEFDTGFTDNGSPIKFNVETAFNYCKDNKQEKRFTLARPTVKSNGQPSFAFNINTDFKRKEVTTSIQVEQPSGAKWNSVKWNSTKWGSSLSNYSQNWYSITGKGRSVSVQMKGDFNNVDFAFSSINLIYEKGGFI